MVIDQAANIAQAASNAGLSKTSDPLGTGSPTNCKLITLQGIFETLLARLQEEGGDLANETETAARRKALWDDNKPRPPDQALLGGLEAPALAERRFAAEDMTAAGQNLPPIDVKCRPRAHQDPGRLLSWCQSALKFAGQGLLADWPNRGNPPAVN